MINILKKNYIIIFIGIAIVIFSNMYRLTDDKSIAIFAIILLGIINYCFEWLIEKTFNDEMRFFNNFSRQASSFARKLWQFAKNIMLLLIMQYIGLDLLSPFLDELNMDKKDLLFESVVVIGAIAIAFNAFSIGVKSLLNKGEKLYRDKHRGFSLKVPSHWMKEKKDVDLNRSVVFNDKMSDKWCYLLFEEKEAFDSKTSLKDFSKFELEYFQSIDGLEYREGYEKNSKLSKKHYYENFVFLKKRKCAAYIFFCENDKYFFELRIIVPEKRVDIEEVEAIIESLTVIDR